MPTRRPAIARRATAVAHPAIVPGIAPGDVLAWPPWIVRFVFFYVAVFLGLVTQW